jgi:hypothetical protein
MCKTFVAVQPFSLCCSFYNQLHAFIPLVGSLCWRPNGLHRNSKEACPVGLLPAKAVQQVKYTVMPLQQPCVCAPVVLDHLQPAVAFANVGELAVDLLVCTLKAHPVARLDSDNLLACVGNNAYNLQPAGLLATALELYQVPGEQLPSVAYAGFSSLSFTLYACLLAQSRPNLDCSRGHAQQNACGHAAGACCSVKEAMHCCFPWSQHMSFC